MNFFRQIWHTPSGQRQKNDELQQLRDKISELELKEKQLQTLNVNFRRDFQDIKRTFQNKFDAQEKRYKNLLIKANEINSLAIKKIEKENFHLQMKNNELIRKLSYIEKTKDGFEPLYMEAKDRCNSEELKDILFEMVKVIEVRNQS
jgi:hypothetical protein